MTPTPAALAVLGLRAGWGVALLAVPDALLRAATPTSSSPTGAARGVLRVLGVRQLLQAAATARWPRPDVLAAGAGVDVLHGLSGIALAVLAPRWRRGALLDAAAASAFAVAGAVRAQSTRRS